MTSKLDRYVLARENNVVRVNFHRDPEPPAPRFPGAGARRLGSTLEPVNATSMIKAEIA